MNEYKYAHATPVWFTRNEGKTWTYGLTLGPPSNKDRVLIVYQEKTEDFDRHISVPVIWVKLVN